MNKHGIAKFVTTIISRGESVGYALEQFVVREGAQQLEMAIARLVNAGHNRIDDAQIGSFADPSAGHAAAVTNAAVAIGGGFESADHARSDGKDSSPGRFRATDRDSGRLRDAIGLIEGEPQVE